MDDAPASELPGVLMFIPEDARKLIGMTQRRGFRIHQLPPWTSSVIFDIPGQWCQATFRGKAMPCVRFYRLVYDHKAGKVDFYVYRFLFFRRRAFSLPRDSESRVSQEMLLKQYKEQLKSIPL